MSSVASQASTSSTMRLRLGDVASCGDSLYDLLSRLEKAGGTSILAELPAGENAQVNTALAFAVTTLYFLHLKTRGIDHSKHPIQRDLDRAKHYFLKLQKCLGLSVQRKIVRGRPTTVNVEAAERIVKFHTAQLRSNADLEDFVPEEEVKRDEGVGDNEKEEEKEKVKVSSSSTSRPITIDSNADVEICVVGDSSPSISRTNSAVDLDPPLHFIDEPQDASQSTPAVGLMQRLAERRRTEERKRKRRIAEEEDEKREEVVMFSTPLVESPRGDDSSHSSRSPSPRRTKRRHQSTEEGEETRRKRRRKRGETRRGSREKGSEKRSRHASPSPRTNKIRTKSNAR